MVVQKYLHKKLIYISFIYYNFLNIWYRGLGPAQLNSAEKMFVTIYNTFCRINRQKASSLSGCLGTESGDLKAILGSHGSPGHC